jgi:hypothetical protein
MLLAVVFVPTAALEGARADLRKLLLPGQRRIHTYQESPRRRRILLDTVAGLEAAAVVFGLRRSSVTKTETEGRRLLLTAAGAEVCNRQVSVWVLDDVEPVQRARDRQAVRGVIGDLVYDHRPGYAEPLLWAADAICWAVGAGRDWRRRVDAMVEVRNGP